jgi:deoxyribodipyrimidine photo-lyase
MDVKERVRILNTEPVRTGAKYVLYWAQMNRRVDSNHGLLHAVQVANSLGLPVLYYEGLTCSYPYANERLHTFILEGVPETERRLRKLGIGYLFYLHRRNSDPNDVLYRLAQDAAVIVTDDYPTFIAARNNSRAPAKVDRAYHAVDSSCVVPMSCFEKQEYAAYTIRPKIHKLLPQYLRPLDAVRVRQRYRMPPHPLHTRVTDRNTADLVASCEIDHGVRPSLSFHGGRLQAEQHLDRFLEDRLRRYARDRNEPSAHATSELSPYLHFGQISSLEVALQVKAYAREQKLSDHEFLEELIVRRELAFNFARCSEHYDSLESLPDWARRTLQKHRRDKRLPVYTQDQFESAATHDALWNATQKEMLLRGKIHGYYRMYWGKKIIEWSRSPEEASETMICLHDRYALDARDPNTYANILWCFGLHDRPWPERPIFGTVRYISLDGMRRKTDVNSYLKEIQELERTGRDPRNIE